jgi:branched-chain amino acid transport system substrate-binding protein
MAEVKKILFLLFSCLLLVVLVLPACAKPSAENVIRVGIIGPMTFPEGEHQWMGAQLGAKEVNDNGGIKIGDKTYMIQLIQADDNEVLSTTDAAAAMEKLITVDKADFIYGGFRTEAVFPMQDVAMNYKKIFFDYGAATAALCGKVNEDYDRYKYFFKGTPFNEYFLVNNIFMVTAMVNDQLKKELNIDHVKVAIIAEKLQWAEAMVSIAQARLPSMGMELVGTWRPSDTATDVSAELTAIAAKEPQMIFCIFSGPVGITFAKQQVELDVPACSLGVFVEAQKSAFMEATGGKGLYFTTLNTFTREVAYNDLTQPFVTEFVNTYNQVPLYTAATYDGMIALKTVLEKAQSLDADTVVPFIEDASIKGTVGVSAYYKMGDNCPPNCAHDLVYGPGYVTGVCSQWQSTDPIMGSKVVWPQPYTGVPDAWKDLKYGGTYPYVIPPNVIAKFKQAAPPAAPPEEAKPEAPAAGGLSFEAAEYANTDLGFSVKYPKTWKETKDEEKAPTVFYAADPNRVPTIRVAVIEAATFADAVKAGLEAGGASDVKVGADKEVTLADGTKATAAKVDLKSHGYGAEAYAVGVKKGDKWVTVTVSTVGLLVPYDEAKLSEVAKTLEFK